MRIDTPEHLAAIQKIVPLVAWAITKMQSDLTPDALRRLSPRSRASLVHDFAFDFAEENIEHLDGIILGHSNGLRFFVLDDVKVRLHKVDKDSREISVNRNEQTRRWNALPTSRQEGLPGLPDPNVHFSLAYAPDLFWTKLAQVGVGLYRWDKPVSFLDIDIDDWYGQLPATLETIRPITDRPKLRLRTPATQPLEGIDNNGSGR